MVLVRIGQLGPQIPDVHFVVFDIIRKKSTHIRTKTQIYKERNTLYCNSYLIIYNTATHFTDVMAHWTGGEVKFVEEMK